MVLCESWNDFIDIMKWIRPWTPTKERAIVSACVSWAEHVRPNVIRVDVDAIDRFITHIKRWTQYFEGDVYWGLWRCINFLKCLNNGCPLENLSSQKICESFMHYWYDEKCNDYPEPEPVLPPPPPPPPGKPEPENIYNQHDCDRYGYYWFEGKCYRNIGDYLGDFAYDVDVDVTIRTGDDYILSVINNATKKFEHWKSKLGYNFQEWAWDAATLQAGFEYMNRDMLSGLGAMLEVHWEEIGDVSELSEDSIVETILSMETGVSGGTSKVTEKLLDWLDIRYDTAQDYIALRSGGVAERINTLARECFDAENNISIATLSTVEDMLIRDYHITKGMADSLKEKSDYSYDQLELVKETFSMPLVDYLKVMTQMIIVTTESVEGEIDRESWDSVTLLGEYLIPASVGWVHDVLRDVGQHIFDLIEDVTVPIANSLNTVVETLIPNIDALIAGLNEVIGNRNLLAGKTVAQNIYDIKKKLRL